MRGVTYERIPDSSTRGFSDVEMSEKGGLERVSVESPKVEPVVASEEKDKVLKMTKMLAGVVLTLSVVAFGFSLLPEGLRRPDADILGAMSTTNDDFDSYSRYVMKNFDVLKPMANFLAGVGGLWGVPMWAFYVNRGQALTSFGVANKDGAIEGFVTAEKAYQETPFTGFRTFLKAERNGECFTHEPFFPSTGSSSSKEMKRNMHIGMNEVEISEEAPELGLDTNVLYFTIPNEDFPALIRQTTFTNTRKGSLKMDVLDGLAKLIPAGLTNAGEAAMGRTYEAWMKVYNVGNNGEGDFTRPFFHITQGTADTSTVQLVKEGHFAVSYIEGSKDNIPFIVDPTVVFGTDTAFLNPSGFYDSEDDMGDFMEQPQGTTARTPCAFAGTSVTIPSGQDLTITTVIGHAPDLETFIGQIDGRIRSKNFSKSKREEAIELCEEIVSTVATDSNLKIFDDYVKQDYLDNVLRGGLPLPLGEDKKIFHVFSRIHGDIERDYNNFQIDTTYFSQGPGNFRDVNQNRRLDVLTNPLVGDFNIRNFLSFVQGDGFNPLTVASTNFRVYAEKLDALLDSLAISDDQNLGLRAKAKEIFEKPYRPGQLFQDMKTSGVEFGIDKDEALDKIVTVSEQVFAAQYAQNGYWTDHWTYTLDLVMNYLAVFPDKEESMLWESDPVPFYMSPSFVKTRADRYVLVDNPNKPGTNTVVVQMAVCGAGDLSGCYPAGRQGAMEHIWGSDDFVGDAVGGGVWQRTKDDDVFYTTTVGKLALLGILKAASLDPQGMGVDMEGGKPGWNDAMNGLPGLLGSGMPETYEALRILKYVHKVVEKYDRGIGLPVEFYTLVQSVLAAMDTYDSSAKDVVADHAYWDACNTARETYRESILLTFDGENKQLNAQEFIRIVSKFEAKLEAGIDKAVALGEGISPTYFYYECTDYSTTQGDDVTTKNADGTTSTTPGPTMVTVNNFRRRDLPKFLEGPTRHLKVISDADRKNEVYNLVSDSELYDKALEMFTVSASLKSMGAEVGRMVAFSPGWLENQSVWLHMSYKFYLELLRGGLYEEFYKEIQTGLVPFMDASVYGRSPVEAASFIVSSAFPDKKLHGASFLARLSGSTAEFLSMWAIMVAGEYPFHVEEGQLALSMKPVLPSWLFKDDGTFSFTFLGAVKVTYHNEKLVNTWDATVSRIIMTLHDGSTQKFYGSTLTGDAAKKVRSSVKSLDIYM